MSGRYQVRPVFPFEDRGRRFAFVVDTAAFVEVDEVGAALVDHLACNGTEVALAALHESLDARHGRGAVAETIDAFRRLEVLLPPEIPVITPEARVPIRPGAASLVLHVSHDCNLRCGYCYADHGRYGGEAGTMSPETAVAWVDQLFDRAGDRKVIHLTLFGGEPLLAMPTVRAAIDRARARARASGQELRLGLTTNGTLLTEDVARYLMENRVTVSVSLDGPADVNDRLRRFAEGGGTYQAVLDAVRRTGIRAVARITLTRRSTDVARIVRSLIEVGFVEVGAAPVATGKELDLGPAELAKVLDGYRALAEDLVEWAKRGKVFPFSNLKAVVSQIERGETRGMPCGAGIELVAGDMNGDLWACHRFVGDARMRLGSMQGGVDPAARFEFLQEHHMRTRPACGGCWARFLCGGGCHHIAHVQSPAGVAAQLDASFCDFLRGFYRLGLGTYARVLEEAPEVLSRLVGEREGCSQPTGL
ncbi:MAG: radical SAM protein [Deltaproteobacteria bacterium]|nr:radical SAM protein [Deltaproteobacteria bacterium]